MTTVVLLAIAAIAAIAAAALCLARQQAQANGLARAELERWEADLRQRERNVAKRCDRWITERGAWAVELESAKAAAVRANYWQRQASELKRQLQEVA